MLNFECVVDGLLFCISSRSRLVTVSAGDWGGGGSVAVLNSRGVSFRSRSGLAAWMGFELFVGTKGEDLSRNSGVKKRSEI